ncbi:aldehyde dehydrogenase family protein [Streptomyces bambusae]|uniref:aldehyde dehydrogenase family protein n=1 Tax=Streptomyces bambusae TaxID=1550616 RepID=UPI001CFDD0E2|nr:aldehyde dehydrogenase family protein [Streptomyces bambusae]MCB5166104.1 aldehyde dehydrogenase family protein [Streptomyces bambusae]
MLISRNESNRSWDEVRAACAGVIRELEARGVGESHRVLLSCANSAASVLATFALMELGVSVGLVDRGVTPNQLARLVEEANADFFVSDHEQSEPAFDKTAARWIPLADLGGDAAEQAAGPAADLSFDRWARRSDALIVWTSGSLGRPKGIVRSGSSVLANVSRTQDRMKYTESDVLMPLLPFTHQYGLSILLLWWQAKAGLVLLPSRRTDQALEAVVDHGVTVVDSVPAVYEGMLRMLDRGHTSTTLLESVRMWCVGGEPLQDDLLRRFTEQTGKPLLDGYGSSEAGNVALASPDNPHHAGRPLTGITVTVVDDEDRPLPPGEVGEVVVHTPDIMVGTLEPGGRVRESQRTAHRTQDLGYLDADGNLRVLGRKAAVHRFGNTLYPDAITAKASECGRPVRVIPVENGRFGTDLVFVVADPEERPAAHWRRIFAELVAEYEQPNKVLVVKEFPAHTNGKANLTALGYMAQAALRSRAEKAEARQQAAAKPAGPAIPFNDRITVLRDVARLLGERRTEILGILTEVCNHRTAADEIDASLEALEGAVAEVARYGPQAAEQTAVLMPSNIPLYGYILYVVIPSLYSRRIVFRPSRMIGEQTRALHKLIGTVHDLPLVLDDSEQREFMDNVGKKSDVLVFTGSYENAETIREQLPRETVFCFFGQGINPFVVGGDAHLGRAVDGLVRVRMLNSGQDCFGPDVVFVHTSVSAQFCNLLSRRVEALRLGTPHDATADYSAMFYDEAFESTLDYLRGKREFVAAGGRIDFIDRHVRPTVLIHPTDTPFLPPEMFAPVFNVVPYSSQEWLNELLRHPYYAERAMAATVFGTMPETVEALRDRHMVSVDETLIDIENGNKPFGGRGIRANYISVGRKRHTEPLLLSKAVADYLPGKS